MQYYKLGYLPGANVENYQNCCVITRVSSAELGTAASAASTVFLESGMLHLLLGAPEENVSKAPLQSKRTQKTVWH